MYPHLCELQIRTQRPLHILEQRIPSLDAVENIHLYHHPEAALLGHGIGVCCLDEAHCEWAGEVSDVVSDGGLECGDDFVDDGMDGAGGGGVEGEFDGADVEDLQARAMWLLSSRVRSAMAMTLGLFDGSSFRRFTRPYGSHSGYPLPSSYLHGPYRQDKVGRAVMK